MSVKEIVGLMQVAESEEIRRSAAVILGEMGSTDGATGKALLSACKDSDGSVRLAAIRSLGKLKVESALDFLLEKFQSGGEEGEAAAHAATRLGARGVKGLHNLLGKVSPGLRRYIAAALAAAATAPADVAALKLLSDTDPGVVETTVSAMIHSLSRRSPALLKNLAHAVQALAGDKGISQATDQAVTRLLSSLDDPSGNKVLWDRIQPDHPVEVRAAALQSLGRHALKPNPDQLRQLVQCACSRDFPVAAPALILLQKLPASRQSLLAWFPLFKGHDPAARLLAIEKLGPLDQGEIAQALASQVRHPDKRVREAAMQEAAKTKSGQKAILDSLLIETNYDYAWNLSRLVAGVISLFSPFWYGSVLLQAFLHLDKQDRMADPLLFLLREFAPDRFKEELEARAQELRKKKKFEPAVSCLRHLARDPACSLETRLDLACCLLKLSHKELALEARNADASLLQFLALAHREDFPLFEKLKKNSWVDSEDLFFVGFHLAEQDNRARRAAFLILNYVVKKGGKGKTAQAARQKIKACMLDE
ncbi:MAG: HEAT repeat domain-containing protein [Gemmataceae bacterium]|nr:HEAT repeat domain-containing protein [Gemmataceae bacterium]